MFKKFYWLLTFVVFITCFSMHYSPGHAMHTGEGFHQHVGGTDVKKGRKDYAGYTLTENDKEALKNVPIQLCTSLGKSCNTKISEYIDRADEFVVVFMYRFNSPAIINSLANKYLEHEGNIPILIFLDYNQSIGTQTYHNYIKHLTTNVPTTLVKAGSKSFHQKVTICKKRGEEAFVILGSANATFEADNIHSEDYVIIQNNRLAYIYIKQFYKFLKMKIHSPNEQVITFHDHRFKGRGGNTEYLKNIRETLNKKEKTTSEGVGIYASNIVSLGISTGFALGNTKCFDVFKDAIKEDKTSPLILFENYLTISQDHEDLWKLLLNKTPKLIVLNKDKGTKEKSNFKSAHKLEEGENNKILLFRPYTGGKFHHKLLINYSEEKRDILNSEEENDPPIIYTGSFHLSNNAITNNSENIIGIASKELVENYIASILWQSSLASQQEVWVFIGQHPKTFSESAPIKEVAKKMFLQANFSIKKIPYQFKYLMEKLLLIEGEFFSSLKEFKKEFIKKFGLEKIKKELFPQKESEIILNDKGRISLFNEGRSTIFNCPVHKYILSVLGGLQIRGITDSIPDLANEPSKETIKKYLDDLEEWIEETQIKLELKKYKNRSDIDSVKERVNTVNHMYNLLRQAYDFPEKLQDFLSFKETIFQTGFLEIVSEYAERDNAIMENIEEHENQPVEEKSEANEFCEFIRFLINDKNLPEKEIKSFLKGCSVAKSSITRIINGENISPKNSFTAGNKLKEKYSEFFGEWSKKNNIQ